MAPLHTERPSTVTTTAASPADEEGLLLHRLAQGDTTAFWEVWERYRCTVFRHCCLGWMGGHHEDAEDALSSACIRAWKYFPAHACSITNAKAWLMRLLYNHCMTLWKAERDRQYYVRSVTDPTAMADASVAGMQESAEDALLQHELRAYIRRLVNALPSRLREPLSLYFFQGMPQRDIAAYLNLSPENVRKRLQQGRHILRVQLTQYLRGEDDTE